jgi:hypothetical protein
VLASMTMGRGPVIALVAAGAICGVVACTAAESTAPPLGTGDHLIVDVDASTLPPQTDTDAAPDPTFAPVDGSSIYGQSYDASYPVLTVCNPPDASTGAEGGAGQEAAAADASGAATDPYPADGAASACQPLPAACESQPDCPCLLQALAAQLACVPSCSVGKSFFSLFCP